MQVERDVELRSGTWRAVISPANGGRVRWLGSAGPEGRHPWVRPLVVQRGVLVGGAGVQLVPPFRTAEDGSDAVPDPKAFDQPWQLTGQDTASVAMMQHGRGPAPGAWSYHASQTLTLSHNRLTWTWSVRNLSRQAMPARLGWRLHFLDRFSEEVSLGEDGPTWRQPVRGQVAHRPHWSGLATLANADGRAVLIRSGAPVQALCVERHATRAWVHVDLLTADWPEGTSLPRGEEVSLQLTLDLLSGTGPLTAEEDGVAAQSLDGPPVNPPGAAPDVSPAAPITATGSRAPHAASPERERIAPTADDAPTR
jgi:hypothetical protein